MDLTTPAPRVQLAEMEREKNRFADMVAQLERRCHTAEEENRRMRDENNRLKDELSFLREQVRAVPAVLPMRGPAMRTRGTLPPAAACTGIRQAPAQWMEG